MGDTIPADTIDPTNPPNLTTYVKILIMLREFFSRPDVIRILNQCLVRYEQIDYFIRWIMYILYQSIIAICMLWQPKDAWFVTYNTQNNITPTKTQITLLINSYFWSTPADIASINSIVRYLQWFGYTHATLLEYYYDRHHIIIDIPNETINGTDLEFGAINRDIIAAVAETN